VLQARILSFLCWKSILYFCNHLAILFLKEMVVCTLCNNSWIWYEFWPNPTIIQLTAMIILSVLKSHFFYFFAISYRFNAIEYEKKISNDIVIKILLKYFETTHPHFYAFTLSRNTHKNPPLLKATS